MSTDWTRALPSPFVSTLRVEDSTSGTLLRAAIGLLLLVVAGAASLRLTLRLAGPLGVLVLVLAMTAPAAHALPPVLNYACSPAPADCVGWYRSPVTLSWDWDGLVAVPSAGLCSQGVYSTDTPGTETYCEVVNGSQQKTRVTLTLHIDRTPPSLTGAFPDRPPDYAGWFNHPVGLHFQASDATSGVAACDSVPYGGPEGAGVLVSGSCRDVAGNVSSGAFGLNYDATPPAAPAVDAIPGNKLVDIDWSLPQGAVSVEVARVGPGANEVVYRGAKREFVDRGLRNGVRHRYRVTAIDRAGNRKASETSAVPTSSPLLTPAAGSRLTSPPLLAWKKRKHASYYNVQLFRGNRKVLSIWPRDNRLRLHKSWRYGGKRFRLLRGRYVWYVWPGFGKRAARNYGRMLGKRSFVIAR